MRASPPSLDSAWRPNKTPRSPPLHRPSRLVSDNERCHIGDRSFGRVKASFGLNVPVRVWWWSIMGSNRGLLARLVMTLRSLLVSLPRAASNLPQPPARAVVRNARARGGPARPPLGVRHPILGKPRLEDDDVRSHVSTPAERGVRD